MSALPSCLAGGPVQIAYCVDDVREAASQWVALGAGPFFIRDHIEVSDSVVFGSPASFDHSSAYGQWGEMMVELVAVHDPPQLRRSGVHHMAFLVESFADAATELSTAGYTQAMRATAGSTDFAFHDATADLGHYIEIYEGSDGLRGFYAMVRTASVEWDGSDPIRVL